MNTDTTQILAAEETSSAFLFESQMIDYSSAEKIIQKIDSRFQKNIAARQPLESKWLAVVQATIEGNQLGEKISRLMKTYTNLGDPTYSTSIRNQSAKFLSFLDSDFFRLNADGYFITDLELLKANTEIIKQKIRNNKSGFYNTMELFDLQLRLLNISALAYSFTIQYKKSRNELLYQGGRWDFVNMFNCYPDTMSADFHDLDELDVFFRTGKHYSKILLDPKYDPNQPSFRPENILFKDNSKVSELKDSSYHRSSSETNLLNFSDESQHNTQAIGYVDLRTAFVREVECNGELYQNLNITYIKSDRLIPLLIEKNPFDFNEKPIRFVQQWKNPYALYGESPHQLAYNASCYTSFLKAAEAFKMGKSVFSSVCVPGSFIEAVKSMGIDDPSLTKAIQEGVATIIPFDDRKAQGPSFVFPLETEGMRDISLLNSSKGTSMGDQQQLATIVQTPNVGNSTATGINYVASQEDAAMKQERHNLFERVIAPTIKMMLQDLSELMLPENIQVEITQEELENMVGVPIEQARQTYRDQKRLLPITNAGVTTNAGVITTEGEEIPLNIGLNPITMKKHYQLNQYHILRGELELQLEGDSYSKEIDAQKFTQLYSQMLQVIGQSAPQASMLIAQAAIKQLNYLTDNPAAEEINRIVAKAVEKVLEPPPTDPMTMMGAQIQLEKTQAETRKLDAEAKEEASRATSQELTNQERIQQQTQQALLQQTLQNLPPGLI